MYLFFNISFFFLSLNLFASEEIIEEELQIASVDQEDNSEEQQKIEQETQIVEHFVISTNFYQRLMQASRGCCIKSGINKLFNTSFYTHSTSREWQLIVMRQLLFLEDGQTMAILFNYLRNNITPFKSESGMDFATSMGELIKHLEKFQVNSPKQITNEESVYSKFECIVCLDNNRSVICEPCMHIATCQSPTCINYKNCPICRRTKSKLIKLKSALEEEKISPQCLSCKVEKPNIIWSGCGHMYHCEKCDQTETEKEIKNCRICETKGERKKIFIP